MSGGTASTPHHIGRSAMTVPVRITTAVELAWPDPGLVFLQLASTRLLLVEAGEIEIDDAIAGLTDAVEAVYGPRCSFVDELVEHWERTFVPTKRRRPRRAA
jgi:hypothetical protein